MHHGAAGAHHHLRFSRLLHGAVAAVAVLCGTGPSHAADPVRGASLFANTPRPGLLICIDCHSDNPIVNNFGNIWSGRNAVAMIQRAVSGNTGGMAYLGTMYSAADFADIAAYLGNSPSTLSFGATELGATSAAQSVTLTSSTKQGFGALSVATEGDFVVAGGSCGSALPRFSSCTVDVAFRPAAMGTRTGTLLISHDGTPTPVRIALSGEGPRRPPALASVQPTRLALGEQALGGSGPARNVVLSNASNERLTLGSFSADPAEFIIAGGSCVAGTTLLPAQRCSVSVRMAPQSTGERRGTLTLRHDGVGGASTVALQGRGLATAPVAPQLDVSHLDFGVVPASERSVARLVTVSHAGVAALRWREIASTDAAFIVEPGSCRLDTALAPQQRCQLAVTFAPGRAAVFSGELRLLADGANQPLRLPLLGRAMPTAAGAAPARLLLHEVLGQSSTHQVAMINRGLSNWTVQALTLTGPEAGDFALTGGSCRVGVTLAPGTQCLATLSFTPRSVGTRMARLQLAHDGGATPLSVELQGQAQPEATPQLWLDASALDFGERARAAAALASSRTVTLRNRGRSALVWSSLALVGDQARDFSLAGSCRAETALPADASCDIEVRFAPAAVGARTASLVLWPAGSNAPAVVALSGRGVDLAAASLVADAVAVDFGTQRPGSATATRTVRLRNLGSGPARPTFSTEGPFVIRRLDPACTAALAPGEGCTLELEFLPPAMGPHSGRLLVTTAGAAALGVALQAHAAEAAPALQWQVPPAAPTHDVTSIGHIRSGQTWTLINLGNAPSPPLAWTITGDAADDYSIDSASSCAPVQVLTPQASCTMRLNFHPTRAGVRLARLGLRGTFAVDEVLLLGQARAAAHGDLRALPPELVFASRIGSATPAQALLLSNEGGAALQVLSLATQGSAFEQAPGSAGCPDAPFELLPGDACSLWVSWNGSAAGQLGGRVVAGGDGLTSSASVPLSVSEDPEQRSNIGAGGGASTGAWWLLLVTSLAVLLRLRTKSPDG